MSIKIHKVKELPLIIEPSSIYLVKSDTDTDVTIYICDRLGQIAYTTPAAVVEEDDVLTIVNALKNQPDGIAGVDSNSLISTDIGINGQDMMFLADNGEYLWKDLVSNFVVRGIGGANNPTFGVVFGNMQGLLFRENVMTQVWCDYHIGHDIALNTKVYPHVHWTPTTNNLGTVRWGFEYTVAKGFGQQVFHNPITVYVDEVIREPSLGKHFISEVSEADAIPFTNIEPDSYVKMRVFRAGNMSFDTFPKSIHAWACDLHYQAVRIGTKNKRPDFFL